MSRILCEGAIALRKAIMRDEKLGPAQKLGVWRQQVTDEHQDPEREIEMRWVNAEAVSAKRIVVWLLQHPSVIVLR